MTEWAAFVARKEAEALAARLEPWKADADAHGDRMTPIGNAWSRALFDGDFYISRTTATGLPSTSLVFVQSHEGNTVAKDPSSLGGGESDKHLIYEGLSRVAADAVMAGAETIRGGRIVFSVWHPELVALRRSLDLPRHPVQIVATLRGLSLDEGVLFNEPSLRVLLLTVPTCSDLMREQLAPRPWITPVVMSDAHSLAEGLRAIRQSGIDRISCVGGRTLANQLLGAGLVQDLYLTTSPRSGGEPDTPLALAEADVVVRKHGTGADTGVIFEHRSLSAAVRYE